MNLTWHDARTELQNPPLEKEVEDLGQLAEGYYVMGPQGNFIHGPHESMDEINDMLATTGKYEGERVIHFGAVVTAEEADAK